MRIVSYNQGDCGSEELDYATPENLELLSAILRQACACGRLGWKCDLEWHDFWQAFNVGGTSG